MVRPSKAFDCGISVNSGWTAYLKIGLLRYWNFLQKARNLHGLRSLRASRRGSGTLPTLWITCGQIRSERRIRSIAGLFINPMGT
jgi:hypothetical protein